VRPIAILAAVVLGWPTAAAAQNLLANPRFDTDLSGWIALGNATWQAEDADMSVYSGSVNIVSTAVDQCRPAAIRQCLPAGSAAYDLSFKSRGTRGSVFVLFFASADCSGDSIENSGLAISPQGSSGVWTSNGGRAVRPSGTLSMMVSASVIAPAPCLCGPGFCSIAGMLLDDFSLTKAPPPPPTLFHTVPPCRLLDTRSAGGGPISAQAEIRISTFGLCGIPSTAKALALNLTATEATDAGDLRLITPGGGLPIVSTINYGPAQTRANNAIIALGADGDVIVHSDQRAGSVHFIIDVTGYFQ
jgi:hypothetical protein